ncbi:hypothetical protein M5E82_07515 [Parabacteroides distasonis]|nr:hypothetical protein M5E82_07515 [Parabacteroides distasonis]
MNISGLILKAISGRLLREASSPKSRAFSAFRSSGSVRLAGREVGVSVFLFAIRCFV